MARGDSPGASREPWAAKSASNLGARAREHAHAHKTGIFFLQGRGTREAADPQNSNIGNIGSNSNIGNINSNIGSGSAINTS